VQLLFIENVGNLICPASFDPGEDEKMALMSVTEGKDKPLCRQNARQVHPGLRIIETSAYSQIGMEKWLTYLREKVRAR
jgi:hydrogenase nickel incorporation protein HypB